MENTHTQLEIEGKPVDLSIWLSDIRYNEQTGLTSVVVPMRDYSALHTKIRSLLTICQQAAIALEHGENAANGYDFANVLELVSDMLPTYSMELIEKMQEGFTKEEK